MLNINKDMTQRRETETIIHEEPFQGLPELASSLGVNHITVLKCSKALGMIQKP